jgi:uncharacterized coiled-coil protein SlyX
MDFKNAEDTDARGRIAALEEKANQQDSVIAILKDKVTQRSTGSHFVRIHEIEVFEMTD